MVAAFRLSLGFQSQLPTVALFGEVAHWDTSNTVVEVGFCCPSATPMQGTAKDESVERQVRKQRSLNPCNICVFAQQLENPHGELRNANFEALWSSTTRDRTNGS